MEYYSAANSWESRKESPAQSKPENQKQEKSQKVRDKYSRLNSLSDQMDVFGKYRKDGLKCLNITIGTVFLMVQKCKVNMFR
jgi:hypothetical protein